MDPIFGVKAVWRKECYVNVISASIAYIGAVVVIIVAVIVDNVLLFGLKIKGWSQYYHGKSLAYSSTDPMTILYQGRAGISAFPISGLFELYIDQKVMNSIELEEFWKLQKWENMKPSD